VSASERSVPATTTCPLGRSPSGQDGGPPSALPGAAARGIPRSLRLRAEDSKPRRRPAFARPGGPQPRFLQPGPRASPRQARPAQAHAPLQIRANDRLAKPPAIRRPACRAGVHSGCPAPALRAPAVSFKQRRRGSPTVHASSTTPANHTPRAPAPTPTSRSTEVHQVESARSSQSPAARSLTTQRLTQGIQDAAQAPPQANAAAGGHGPSPNSSRSTAPPAQRVA